MQFRQVSGKKNPGFKLSAARLSFTAHLTMSPSKEKRTLQVNHLYFKYCSDSTPHFVSQACFQIYSRRGWLEEAGRWLIFKEIPDRRQVFYKYSAIQLQKLSLKNFHVQQGFQE